MAAGWAFQRSKVAVKSFNVKIDEVVYTIPPKVLAYEELDETNTTQCLVSIVYNRDASSTTILLGQPFVETFVTRINYEKGEF